MIKVQPGTNLLFRAILTAVVLVEDFHAESTCAFRKRRHSRGAAEQRREKRRTGLLVPCCYEALVPAVVCFENIKARFYSTRQTCGVRIPNR